MGDDAGADVTDAILDAADRALALHPDRTATGHGWPCCEWVARLVCDAYALPHLPGDAWWRRANVWDGLAPWSSVEAYLEIGDEVATPRPYTWHVVQGWRRLSGPDRTMRPGDIGHTWLWRTWADARIGVTLDSSVEDGPKLAGVHVERGPLAARLYHVGAQRWTDRAKPYAAGVRLVALRMGTSR